MSHVDLCLRFTFIVLVLEGTESCCSESRWVNDACHVVFFPSEKEDALSHQACCGSALLSSVFFLHYKQYEAGQSSASKEFRDGVKLSTLLWGLHYCTNKG